jgi:hypothetical protein
VRPAREPVSSFADQPGVLSPSCYRGAHFTISTVLPSGAFRSLICAGIRSASGVRCVNAPGIVHPLDAIAEGLRILEGIRLGHLLDQRHTGDQVDEVLDDPCDAHPVGLILVVGDHGRAGLERQEQLGQARPSTLARS